MSPLYRGYALASDIPHARSKYLKLNGVTYETFDITAFSSNAAVLATGRLTVAAIALPAGFPVTTITFLSGTTAINGPTHQWFAIADSSRNKLAVTADDTNTAWAANTPKSLTVTGGPYIILSNGLYYLACLTTATVAVPSLITTVDGNAVHHGLAPITAGTSDTGLTDPASCPNTLAAITATSQLAYAGVA